MMTKQLPTPIQHEEDITYLRQKVAELEYILSYSHVSFDSMCLDRAVNSDDVLYIADTHGIITYVNAAITHMLEYSPHDIIGKRFIDFISIEDRDCVFNIFQQRLQGVIGSVEYRLVARSGDVRWVHSASQPILRDQHVYGVRGVLTDITERKQQEREHDIIVQVVGSLRHAVNRTELAQTLLVHVTRAVSVDGAELLIYNDEMGIFFVEAASGISTRKPGTRILSSHGLCWQVVHNGKMYVTNDVASDPYVQRHHHSHTIHAAACVPLIAHDNRVGAICVHSQQPFLQEDVRLLNAIGDIAANALHRSMLHEQTERRLHYVQALHAIDRAINTSLDVYETLTILLDHVVSRLKVDAADVLLFNSVTNTLDYAASRGFRSDAISNTCELLGAGYAGRAAAERCVVSVSDIEYETSATYQRAALLKAEGLVAYYGVPLIAKRHIKGVLELFLRKPFMPDQEWLDFLNTLAGQAAIAIDNAELFAELQRTNDELVLAYDATIEGWARALELRDVETEGHSRRVTQLTLDMAQHIGFNNEELVNIRRGALLHDIGKMAIPDGVLLKEGPLTDEEFEIMKQHTSYAYTLLSKIPFLLPARDIPYCHHEKWDGSGYPRGLKGLQIPLAARIFAVIDVYDALCSDRPYREKWSHYKTCDYLLEQSGSHFDPDMVTLFLKTIEQYRNNT